MTANRADVGLTPSWSVSGKVNYSITESDDDVNDARFAETAFIGGLNSYRAMDVNWEHDPDYGRATLDTPALFLCGEKDPVLQIITPKSLETMPERVPDLRGIELIADAGHFAQQEQPEAVNAALLKFLDGLD